MQTQTHNLGHHQDLLTLVNKLKEFLQLRVKLVSQTRLQHVRGQAVSGQLEALLALTGEEKALVDVLDFINKLENGSERSKTDFLGADLLPQLEDTDELLEQ